MDREMTYTEYMERMKAVGQHGNAVNGLWKDLAEHFVFFGGIPKNAESSLPECTMPVQDILNLTPAKAGELPKIGPARLKVYTALHRSLSANPHPVGQQDHTKALSREGLQLYASSQNKDSLVGSVWNVFLRQDGVSSEPTFAELEAFCVKLRGKNPPSGFKGKQGALLLGWYEYLKAAR